MSINKIQDDQTQHKAGFVNIVGNPNVGKSTLMNDLVGERMSIITDKAQTTRHRIPKTTENQKTSPEKRHHGSGSLILRI